MSEPDPPYTPPPPTVPPPDAYPVAPYQPYPAEAQYPQYPAYPPPPNYPPYPAQANPHGAPYPPVPYPVRWGAPRSGPATGAAVVGFVLAALLTLTGATLLLGGSLVSDLEDAVGHGTSIGTELAFDGLVNLVAAGLLIAGGTTLLNRSITGRRLLVGGNVLVLADAVYWLARFDLPGASWVWTLLFSVLAAVSLGLALGQPVSRWLAR